jgi:hypothetical protein
MRDSLERIESILWRKKAMHELGLELNFEKEDIMDIDIGRDDKRVFWRAGITFNCDRNDLLDFWGQKKQLSQERVCLVLLTDILFILCFWFYSYLIFYINFITFLQSKTWHSIVFWNNQVRLKHLTRQKQKCNKTNFNEICFFHIIRLSLIYRLNFG